MMIKLSEVRYLPDSTHPPVSTEAYPLPTPELTMVMVLEATEATEATVDDTGGSDSKLQR